MVRCYFLGGPKHNQIMATPELLHHIVILEQKPESFWDIYVPIDKKMYILQRKSFTGGTYIYEYEDRIYDEIKRSGV